MKQKLSEKSEKSGKKRKKTKKKWKKRKNRLDFRFALFHFEANLGYLGWSVVDTYGLLCGPPRRYCPIFLLFLWLSTCHFAKAVNSHFSIAVCQLRVASLTLSGFQQCFEGLLTFCCSGTVRKTVSSPNCNLYFPFHFTQQFKRA